MATSNVTVEGGQAWLPDGTRVDLLQVQNLLNQAFQDSGDAEYQKASEEMARLTKHYQGPNGDFLPGSYEDDQFVF